ncbi:hypothetical protein [Hymenobacter sp. DG01]|nr:hypothetical protein [Hymenobacter sp. DG01]
MNNPSTSAKATEEQVAANFQVEALDQRLETAWSMGSDSSDIEHEAPTAQ